MQLRHLRLVIFLTFPEGFQVFEAHFLVKIFLLSVLPNISRSKSNQPMKFGQLMNYKVRNIILQKIILDLFMLVINLVLKALLKSEATESPLKIMKIFSYFTLKALFILKMLKFFCLDFLVRQKNGLILER